MNTLGTISVPANQTCVYAHYVGEQLIYIGVGSVERAFRVWCRSPSWKALTKDGYRVEILQWFENRDEALEAEKRFIQELKPTTNLLHNGYVPPHNIGNTWSLGRKHSAVSKAIMSAKQKASWARTKVHRRPKVPIKCIDTGEIFPGLREAAKATAANYTSISQCINGQRKKAGGLTFIRMEEG